MKQKIGKTWKAMWVLIAAGLIFFTAGAPSAWAQTKEENKLNTEAITLNKTAGTPDGQKVVTERLKQEFKVTDTQITALRDQKMGYGEMAIVFSLAKQLGGTSGITQENINAIMTRGLEKAFAVFAAGKLSTTWGAIKSQ